MEIMDLTVEELFEVIGRQQVMINKLEKRYRTLEELASRPVPSTEPVSSIEKVAKDVE